MSYLNEYDGIPTSNDAARIALVNRWIATEARPFFAELRERRPIFQTPACTLVTRYRDVISVLSRDDIFTVQSLALKMDPAVGPVMQARDRQTLNWRHKSIMRTMIPMEDVPKIRHMVASIVSPILEKATLTGRLEAVNELGRAVPYRLCGDYFGFPFHRRIVARPPCSRFARVHPAGLWVNSSIHRRMRRQCEPCQYTRRQPGHCRNSSYRSAARRGIRRRTSVGSVGPSSVLQAMHRVNGSSAPARSNRSRISATWRRLSVARTQ